MCGIAGIWGGSEPARAAGLARMLGRLVHRGPDDEGRLLRSPAAIGIRRLSIIDLTTGHQPIANEDETVFCVENGEIYNHVELRRELIERGHGFRTRSDAEVLVHLYEEKGSGVLGRLRGMFALAVVDIRRSRLLLARDRLGEKPLLYAAIPGGIVFASEIDALLDSGLVSREPDPAGLEQILTLGYALAPRTAFRAIRRLPPAHFLQAEADGTIEVRRYWSLPEEPPASIPLPEAEEAFEQTLRDSIRLRLRSDVPVGAFLSGGLDSSLLVALTAQETHRPLRTFTVRFPGSPLDESRWADQVARRWHTRHETIDVEPAEAGSLLDSLAAHHGEPFADASAVPTWCLSRLAASRVKVVLGGDGGDEIMAGYTRYLGERFARVWGFCPRPIRALARGAARVRPRWNRVLRASELDPAGRFLDKSQMLPPRFWQRLYAGGWPAAAAGEGTEEALHAIEGVLAANGGMDWVGRLGACDLRLYLPNDMLFKVDACSMAHSLEVRLPYLDHVLVEECVRLPGRHKLRGWTRKFLMRRVARRFLPAALIARPKQGFTVPLQSWFSSGLQGAARERLLAPGGAAGRILDRKAVEEFVGSTHPPGQALWSLLMLDAWARRYL